MDASGDLDQFFTDYGAALAAGDLEAVADAYGYPSLVLGGPEVILVSSREDVKGAFAGAAEQHRAEGFTRALPEVRVIDDQGAGALWVSVVWTYASDDGATTQRDAYRYLVRVADGALSIVALTSAPVPPEEAPGSTTG